MPYGFYLVDQNGGVYANDIQAAQIIFGLQIFSQSGSIYTGANVNTFNSFIHCLPLDGKVPLAVTLADNGVVSWAPYGSGFGPAQATSNWVLYVSRYR